MWHVHACHASSGPLTLLHHKALVLVTCTVLGRMQCDNLAAGAGSEEGSVCAHPVNGKMASDISLGKDLRRTVGRVWWTTRGP